MRQRGMTALLGFDFVFVFYEPWGFLTVKSSDIFENLRESSRIFNNLRESSRIFENVRESSRIFQNLRESSRTFFLVSQSYESLRIPRP